MRNSEFNRLHPVVLLLYLMYVMVVSMISLHPILLFISFLSSLVYSLYLNGKKDLKKNVLLEIPILIFTILIQPLFAHSGTTAVFYINNNAVCMENYIYGIAIGLLLISMIQWFGCLRYLLSSEKIMYLFGKLTPTIGMIFSMILRLIPLMRQRFKEIQEAQAAMGRSENKIHSFLRALSILVSWSLESSIETSASMESRGYGLKGRKSYHNFRYSWTDVLWMITTTVLFLFIITGISKGHFKIYYLPMIRLYHIDLFCLSSSVAFFLLSFLPLFYDLVWNIRCKRIETNTDFISTNTNDDHLYDSKDLNKERV